MVSAFVQRNVFISVRNVLLRKRRFYSAACIGPGFIESSTLSSEEYVLFLFRLDYRRDARGILVGFWAHVMYALFRDCYQVFAANTQPSTAHSSRVHGVLLFHVCVVKSGFVFCDISIAIGWTLWFLTKPGRALSATHAQPLRSMTTLSGRDVFRSGAFVC